MTSLAPLLFLLSVHLLGGHAEAVSTVPCAALSCTSVAVVDTATIEAAQPEHEPVFGYELKNESSDQDDESRDSQSSASLGDELSGNCSARDPTGLSHALLRGEDSVCAHAPRGPPVS